MYRVLLVCFLLAACSPTPMPMPTAAPTIDLSALLVQEGDFPAGFNGGQLRDSPPTDLNDLPAASAFVSQQLARGERGIGLVAVWLYDDPNAAYEQISGSTGDNSSAAFGSIGERGFNKIVPTGVGLLTLESSFVRCRALAYIQVQVSGPDTITAITAYLQRLDDRLEAQVCPAS